MHTSQTTSQTVRPGNLAEFVRSDLTFDMPAIRAAAGRAFKADAEFLNRWSNPAVRRHWHRAQLRQRLAEVWSDAIDQQHKLIHARVEASDMYTGAEQARMTALSDEMQACAMTAHGNQEFRRIAGERSRIAKAAYERAYVAVVQAARNPAVRRAA